MYLLSFCPCRLVFSQSLYSLDVIEHFLSLLDENLQKDEDERDEQLSKYPGSWSLGLDYFRLDGSTSIDNRNDACKVFNDESNTRARYVFVDVCVRQNTKTASLT